MRKPQDNIESLLKVNKHLRLAISNLEDGTFVGSLMTERKLINLKFRLEEILETTMRAEKRAKQAIFQKLTR